MTSEQIVEEVVKLNIEIIRRVSDLTASISELTTRVNDMMTQMKTATPEDKEKYKEIESKLAVRVDRLEKRLNSYILMTMPRRVRVPQPMPGQMM